MIKTNKHQLIENIIPTLFIAFFMMTSVYFLMGRLSFYHIENIDLDLLLGQVLFFGLAFVLLMGLQVIFKGIKMIAFSVMSYLLFSLLIMIFSPAFSLRLGLLLTSLPPLIYTLVSIKKAREQRYLHVVNLFLWILVLVIFFIFFKDNQIDPESINTSGLTSRPIRPIIEANYIPWLLPLTLTILIACLFNRNLNFFKDHHIDVIVIGLMTLFQIIAFSLVMVYRTKTFSTSTYDFGIYAQMFYNMRHFNGMVTTLERSIELSHMAVHVSPIYYVLLPFFMLFPYLETLQILQIIVVGLGVIPLVLIAKHLKINPALTILISALYLFNPAIISSSYYDLHENAFLPILLLFTIYFTLKKHWLGFVISMILTLMIKEDAGLYLLFIGLFFFFRQKKFSWNRQVIMSIILMTGSMAYFLIVTHLINLEGDGAMFWRYQNLMAHESLGILSVPLSVFQNAIYWLSTLFTSEKIYTLLIILFSLGFLPLLTHKFHYLWLLMPLLIMNLSSNYVYQYQFGFQYFYGSTTLLIVISLFIMYEIQTWSLLRQAKFNEAIAIIPIFIMIIIGLAQYHTQSVYQTRYMQNQDHYESMRERLESIPEDASVLTTGYLTPFLSERRIIYDLKYFEMSDDAMTFDYIILDARRTNRALIELKIQMILYGYQESELSTDNLIILIPAS